MGLEHVKAVFEKYGRDDPMYAVLTDHARRGGRWDTDEFFAHGRQEIESVIAWLDDNTLVAERGAAFDFGCGVGRLTQALAGHFQHVTGVDISSTMVASANTHNKHGDRVQYLVNDVPNLAQFPAQSFNFVYSNITLQHVPPTPALQYIGEFVRLVKDGGLALFQVRVGKRRRSGGLAAWWYRFRREYFRRWWQSLRGRIPYEMHELSRAEVEETVAAAGGRIVHITDMSRTQTGKSLRFAVMRA